MSTTNIQIKHYNTMKIMVVVLSALLIVNFAHDIMFRQSQIEINKNFNTMFGIQEEINQKTQEILFVTNELIRIILNLEKT